MRQIRLKEEELAIVEAMFKLKLHDAQEKVKDLKSVLDKIQSAKPKLNSIKRGEGWKKKVLVNFPKTESELKSNNANKP